MKNKVSLTMRLLLFMIFAAADDIREPLKAIELAKNNNGKIQNTGGRGCGPSVDTQPKQKQPHPRCERTIPFYIQKNSFITTNM